MGSDSPDAFLFAIRRDDGVWYLGRDLEGDWFSPLDDPSKACRFADRAAAEERAAALNRVVLADAEREERWERERVERARWRWGSYDEPKPVVARTFAVVDVSGALPNRTRPGNGDPPRPQPPNPQSS